MLTVRLLSPALAQVAPLHVLGVRDSFQMRWIHARAITTGVVQVEILGDVTVVSRIGDPVGLGVVPVYEKLPIASRVLAGPPLDAAIVELPRLRVKSRWQVRVPTE